MSSVEQPPAIVRWTLRLEDATALDGRCRRWSPRSRHCSAPGRALRCCAATGSATRSTRCSPTSCSAPGPPPLCSTCSGGPTRPPRPGGSSAPAFSPLARRHGPDGRSGRQPGRATSGWASSTPSPTVSRSVCTRRRGSPARGAGAAPGPDAPLPERSCRGPAPTWAATSRGTQGGEPPPGVRRRLPGRSVRRALVRGRASRPQDLVHRLPLGELVDELVQVADLLHQRIVDVLDPHPAHHARDRRCMGWSAASAKKSSKVVPAARWSSKAAWSKPVSHSITSSSSAFVRPFFSTFAT